MNTTPITFWKPELLIRAEPNGLLCVAVKATAPSATKPANDNRPLQRQYVSRT